MTALCQLAGDFRGDLPAGGAMVERKWDGFRALYFTGRDGTRRLWTRNGHPIEGTGHILYRLRQIERAAGMALMIDGEFVVDDAGQGTLHATKAWCESGWKMGGEAGTFHAFDVMPLAEWQAGGCEAPLYRRKAWLAQLVGATVDEWDWRPGSRGRDEDRPAVVFVEDEWAATSADVLDMARRVWSEGGEGVMVKDPMATYRRNRNAAWLKVKIENQHKWARRHE